MSSLLSRRQSLMVGLGGIAAIGGVPTVDGSRTLPESRAPVFDVIDCHTHFYDPTRPEGVPWPAAGSSIYRTVLPQHLRALKHFRKVTGTVIVEASSWLEDNAWLLNLANDDPFVVGIVGHLEPGSPGFSGHLKRFASNQLFRGIRISSGLVDTLVGQSHLGDLKLLAENDLSLDVNGGPETPAILARLAAQLPDLRIVLNHIGNVRITTEPPPAAWIMGIQAAAQHSNISCKISALCSAAVQPGKQIPVDLEYYRPYIDVVWNAFGDRRVMYGSDWPTGEGAADYETQQRIVMEYSLEKGETVTQQFCSLNAKAIYKWVDREGRV